MEATKTINTQNIDGIQGIPNPGEPCNCDHCQMVDGITFNHQEENHDQKTAPVYQQLAIQTGD